MILKVRFFGTPYNCMCQIILVQLLYVLKISAQIIIELKLIIIIAAQLYWICSRASGIYYHPIILLNKRRFMSFLWRDLKILRHNLKLKDQCSK